RRRSRGGCARTFWTARKPTCTSGLNRLLPAGVATFSGSKVTPEVSEPRLAQVLNLWDATCVVVGAIIGVGIFFNPRDVAQITGSAGAAMAAWTVGGVIALLGAIT